MRAISLVVADQAAISSVRNELGQFQSMNQQAKQAHAQMAEKCAETVVEYLMSRIEEHGRDQRGTEELPKALMGDGNRYVSQDGWTFGIPSYLDSTPVGPYWRNLEVGTDVFVGRQFRGWFINVAGEKLFPSELRVDPKLAQYGPVGTDVGQQDQAETITYTFRGKQKTTKAGGQTQQMLGTIRTRQRAPVITIKNPIEGYFYIERGGNEYLASGHIEQVYDELIRRTGVTVTRS